MAELVTFAAEVRALAGKGAARALRRAGSVPAVVYGEDKPQEMVVAGASGAAPAARAIRTSSARFAACR